MSEILRLTQEQSDEIVLIDSANQYKEGTKKNIAGKTFSRFRFNGIVFTADDDSAFVQDFNKGNVDTVKLIKGTRTVDAVDAEGVTVQTEVDTLTFDSHTSFTKTLNRAKQKAQVDILQRVATADLNAETISALLSTEV